MLLNSILDLIGLKDWSAVIQPQNLPRDIPWHGMVLSTI